MGGMFAFGGVDENGRISHTYAAYPLDLRVTRGPLSTTAIESLQIASLLTAAQQLGAAPGVRTLEFPEDDPPDIRLEDENGRRFGVELTTLSIPHVSRQRVAEVRALGRAVEAALRESRPTITHLIGRDVKLSEFASDEDRPERKIGRKFTEAVETIVDVLRDDPGVVDSSPFVNEDGSPMQHVPAERVQQGRRNVGRDYQIEVHAASDPHSAPTVTANAQLEFYEDTVLDTLRQLVKTKEKKCENRSVDALVVSLQLPDTAGFTSPGDWMLYKIVRDHFLAGTFRLDSDTAFQQVILHLWNTGNITQLHASPGAATFFNSAYLP